VFDEYRRSTVDTLAIWYVPAILVCSTVTLGSEYYSKVAVRSYVFVVVNDSNIIMYFVLAFCVFSFFNASVSSFSNLTQPKKKTSTLLYFLI